ncbi:MAG: sensor protein, partial [Verrucomicrobiaceae bacterium]|nr:sensor protein [Verrucomicrobiaceae bacterium]
MIAELIAITAVVSTACFAWRERRQRAAWAAGMEALEATLKEREFIAQQDVRVPQALVVMLPDVKALLAGKAALFGQSQLRLLYETMFNELRHGVLVTSADFTIQFANRAVATLFPGTDPQSRRKLIQEFRDHELDALAHEALAQDALRSRHVRRQTDSMEERVYFVEAAPFPGPQGRGVWILIEDVTDRLLTEQIRKDFVANASHELRTPLTMINGYIETLQDGLLDNPEFARRCLNVMEKHGKRIARIVEDMLAISRLESSDALLKIEPFKVQDCVEDVLEHLTPIIESRQPHISLRFPSD